MARAPLERVRALSSRPLITQRGLHDFLLDCLPVLLDRLRLVGLRELLVSLDVMLCGLDALVALLNLLLVVGDIVLEIKVVFESLPIRVRVKVRVKVRMRASRSPWVSLITSIFSMLGTSTTSDEGSL